MGTDHKNNRREFIHHTCMGLLGLGLTTCSSPETNAGPNHKTQKTPQPLKNLRGRVALPSDPKVFATTGPDEKRITTLFQRSLSNLFDVKDYREALRALFSPKDIIALKLNCLAGPGMSSTPQVVHAIVQGLRAIDVPYDHIIVWERTTAELKAAGFEINRRSDHTYRCYGTDDVGYARKIEFSGQIGSLFTRILSRQATALINVPVLKDHDLSGVSCGMKNMYGAIHNPNRYHEGNCDPFVADVCNHPFIKNKLRLTIADALTAQYHGGPAQVKTHQWRPAQILTATDPVALDTVAHKLIEERRQAKGLASLKEAKRPPKWLATAAKQNQGENRLSQITQIS